MDTKTDPESQEKDDLFSPEYASAGIDQAEAHANDPANAGERDSLFDDDAAAAPKQGKARLFGGRLGRRQAVGGGIAGLVLGGGFGLFMFFSGPLEFIHFSQLMQQLHFSDNEEAQDAGLTRFYRWMRWRDKPANRRLSAIANRYADELKVIVVDAGGTLDEDARGYLRGIDIDVETARSKGVDVDGLAAELKVPIQNGRLRIDISPNNPLKFYRNKKIIRELRKAIGHTGLVASIQGNALGRRGGFTRHPIRKLDDRTREAGADAIRAAWRKTRNAVLGRGDVGAVRVAGVDDDQDPNTKSPAQQEAERLQSEIDAAEPDANGRKAGSIKARVGISAAALATVYCTARDLANSADDTEWEQVVLGSERYASYYMGLGSQVMANQDIDLQQLGLEKELLYDESDDGDDTTQPSSWTSAESIQRLLGNSGGVPLSAAYRVSSGGNVLSEMLAKLPGAVAASLNAACSAAGSFLGRAILLGVNLVTGPISAIGEEGLEALFGDDVRDFLGRKLSGEGLPLDAAGAVLGGIVDQGSFFLSSQELISRGGRILNPAESAELKRYFAELDQAEFESKPFFSRLFDAGDYRSLVSKTMHSTPRSVTSGLAGLFKLPQRSLENMARLFSPPAYAAETDYDYGAPLFGFSLAELHEQDDSHDNPFENVKVLLDTIEPGSGKSYLAYFNDDADLDLKCFGLKLSTSDDSFEVVSLPRIDRYPAECSRPGDDMFLRYRLHVSNIMTFESLACYEGDEDACRMFGY